MREERIVFMRHAMLNLFLSLLCIAASPATWTEHLKFYGDVLYKLAFYLLPSFLPSFLTYLLTYLFNINSSNIAVL